MGTSGSSFGPASGVPYDPPWLDHIVPPQPGEEAPLNDQDLEIGEPGDEKLASPLTQSVVAPKRRFSSARRTFNIFMRTGEKDFFRKAVGHYSRNGMGGARNVAERMRIPTRTGTNLFNLLQSARERIDPNIIEWVGSLAARNASAQEVSDEIIRLLIPTGGSLDEASCEQSMAEALSDLLTVNPDLDLLNLEDDNIWALLESFLGYEAFYRLSLDIGQGFEDSALSPRDRLNRLREMQEYLKAELHAQLDILRKEISSGEIGQLQSILQSALQNTFMVYEGSL